MGQSLLSCAPWLGTCNGHSPVCFASAPLLGVRVGVGGGSREGKAGETAKGRDGDLAMELHRIGRGHVFEVGQSSERLARGQ